MCGRRKYMTFHLILVPPPSPRRAHFYQFGEIQGIHIAQKQKCAFVTFTTRDAAERAADGSFNKTVIRGVWVCLCM